jgi:hypothetical protein
MLTGPTNRRGKTDHVVAPDPSKVEGVFDAITVEREPASALDPELGPGRRLAEQHLRSQRTGRFVKGRRSRRQSSFR